MSPIPLSETDSYVLFQDDNQVFLFDKDKNIDLWSIDTKDEDVTCGLIALSGEWMMIGGRTLAIWENDDFRRIDDFCQILNLKQVGEFEVEVRTKEENGVVQRWLLNIYNEEKTTIG